MAMTREEGALTDEDWVEIPLGSSVQMIVEEVTNTKTIEWTPDNSLMESQPHMGLKARFTDTIYIRSKFATVEKPVKYTVSYTAAV